MPAVATLLITASAMLVLALGTVHAIYTFRGTRLEPREAHVLEAMQRTTPRITRQTTMWRAWVGFNASHSISLLLFGLIYSYLALAAPQFLLGSAFLSATGLGVLLSYVFLARRYFFSTPFQIVVVATALYGAGLIAAAL